jgi:diaminopimelate epimerase
MSVFNSDGTMGANCGNGLRCVAAFLHEKKNLGTHFNILTDSGSKEVFI